MMYRDSRAIYKNNLQIMFSELSRINQKTVLQLVAQRTNNEIVLDYKKINIETISESVAIEIVQALLAIDDVSNQLDMIKWKLQRYARKAGGINEFKKK
ncbi:hypothetical protein QJU83_02335 [Pasteurella skyensis]|uniref:hypothetical protein n=1 Tax=Phocoenobacter skyensis TaxID=97481 RepID=UPI00275D321F|nr:hypothetical protein [Pasteurella skyensis]MDP8176381.1 hypothetical protein [Pasteurella skyensis]MDP8199106.1 hypothetical protein [Pasteurella skyensis]